MSLLGAIDCAGFLFGTLSGLESNSASIPEDADFDNLCYAWLEAPRWRRPSLGDLGAEVTGAWALSGPRRLALSLLLGITYETFEWSTPPRWSVKCELDEFELARRSFPVELLLAVRMADLHLRATKRRSDAAWLVPRLVDDERFTDKMKLGLADGHIHVGASISFPTLFLLAAKSALENHTRLPVEAGVRFTSVGRSYRPDVLLTASAVVMQALWRFVKGRRPEQGLNEFLAERDDADPQVRQAIADGSFWPRTVHAATDRAHLDLDGSAAWLARLAAGCFAPAAAWVERVEEVLPIDEENPEPSYGIAFCQLIEQGLRAPTEDAEFMRQLTQVLRVVCLLHTAVTPSSYGGLDEFMRCFDRQKLVRKSIRRRSSEPGVEAAELTDADLVRIGLRSLTREPELRRLELRLSLPPGGLKVTSRATELARALSQVLTEYSAYREATKKNESDVDPSIAIFPLTFVRRPGSTDTFLGANEVRSTWSFGNIWQLMGTTADLFATAPSALRFFGMIDVAGNERAMPNWVFAVLVQELERRLDPESFGWMLDAPVMPSYTVHAGESFESPLQGLRRIWEVIQWLPAGTRIGHGLALGWDSGGAPSVAKKESVLDLLDDFTWAWGLGSVDVRRRLEDHLLSLSERLFAEAFSPQELWQAYRARFRLQTLIESGLLFRHPLDGSEGASYVVGYHGGIDRSWGNSGPVAQRILFRYLTLGAGVLGLEDSTGPIEQLIRDLYGVLRDEVVKLIDQRGSVIEFCPTSNAMVRETFDYAKHPLFALAPFSGVSVPYTINTDDPGMLHVTVRNEFEALWRAAPPGMRTEDKAKWLDETRGRGLVSCARTLDGADIARELVTCMTQLGG